MPVDTGSDVSHRIMRAATELFFTRGFVNTPLRVIANEAGTSDSGVLRIYHSKYGLLRAVYAHCWMEINTRIDRNLAEAARQDPDPRNLLLALVRAVLEGYQEDPRGTAFLLGHFGHAGSSGLSAAEGIPPEIDEAVQREYRRYLERIHNLCGEVIDQHPVFLKGGVTQVALWRVITAILFGIQTGWYMSQHEPVTELPQVSLDEAMNAVKFYLYPMATAG